MSRRIILPSFLKNRRPFVPSVACLLVVNRKWKKKKGRRNNCFDSIGIYSSCIGGVCHFCLGIGSVREISFPGWMKFQFAFDKLVFRNKKLDRSALVSSIDPENWEKGGSRDSECSKLWLLSGLLSFHFVHVERRVRKLFDGSLKNLFIV